MLLEREYSPQQLALIRELQNSTPENIFCYFIISWQHGEIVRKSSLGFVAVKVNPMSANRIFDTDRREFHKEMCRFRSHL